MTFGGSTSRYRVVTCGITLSTEANSQNMWQHIMYSEHVVRYIEQLEGTIATLRLTAK